MAASVSSINAKKINEHKVNENNKVFNAQPEIAKVALVDTQSRVEQVLLLSTNTLVTVSCQAKHITSTTAEDEVLVQNTQQGWIVIAQLAKPSDSPSAHITDNNGHVIVKGAKSVTLSTRKGTIEVYDDGRIVLEAIQLSASSERDLCLDGWPIRLN